MRIPTFIRATAQVLVTLFAAGSALFYFFIVLAGIKKDGNILNDWYFLRADTSGLPGAPYPVSQWSLYGVCGYELGNSISEPGAFIGCTSTKAAYPFDPKRNFNDGHADETWSQFRNNRYYLETRFQFAFYLITLFVVVVTFFFSFFCFVYRPLAVACGVMSICSFVFGAIAASLTTAAYVEARDVFHKHNYGAKLGPTLYGFAWASVVMSMLNSVLAWFTSNSDSRPRYTGGGLSFSKGGYKFGISERRTTEDAPEYTPESYQSDIKENPELHEVSSYTRV